MKICIKCELKHVLIHMFWQIFMSFYEMQLKQQIFYMGFNQLKIVVQFFKLHQIFPILRIQMRFPKYHRS